MSAPSDERISELVALTERARATAMTGAYEPVGRALLAASDDLGPAIRRLLDTELLAEAMTMITGLDAFWQDSGRADDGQALAERALELASPGDGIDPFLRARTMLTASTTAFRRGDQPAARHWGEAAVSAADEVGDRVTAALGEVSLARVAFREQDAAQIEQRSNRALEIAGEDQAVQRGAYHMLAWAAHTVDDRSGALEWFERSLAIRRAMGDAFGEAVELANMGDLAMEIPDLARAATYLERAMETAIRLESLYLLTSLIGSAGILATEGGDHRLAVVLLSAAEAAYSSTSLIPDPGTRDIMDAAMVKARSGLGAGSEAAEFNGRGLSIDDATSVALATVRRFAGVR
ncbi:MAG: tetratricopeptide repeat protein [Candidatus Limnocylindria bacterium]